MNTTSETPDEAVARKLGAFLPITVEKIEKGVLSTPPIQIAYPAFSTDIASAWEIVESLEDNIVVERWERKVRGDMELSEQKRWRVAIRTGPHESLEAFADTAPEAICRAFLKLESE